MRTLFCVVKRNVKVSQVWGFCISCFILWIVPHVSLCISLPVFVFSCSVFDFCPFYFIYRSSQFWSLRVSGFPACCRCLLHPNVVHLCPLLSSCVCILKSAFSPCHLLDCLRILSSVSACLMCLDLLLPCLFVLVVNTVNWTCSAWVSCIWVLILVFLCQCLSVVTRCLP